MRCLTLACNVNRGYTSLSTQRKKYYKNCAIKQCGKKISIHVVRSRMHISTSVCISWAAYWNEHPYVELHYSANKRRAFFIMMMILIITITCPDNASLFLQYGNHSPSDCDIARALLSGRRSKRLMWESAATAAADDEQQGRQQGREGRRRPFVLPRRWSDASRRTRRTDSKTEGASRVLPRKSNPMVLFLWRMLRS